MSTEIKKTEAPKPAAKHTTPLDANVYRLSNRTPFRNAIFHSKIIIKKHGSVKIEAIGAVTSEATKIAQTLVKHGYALIKSIHTEQFVGSDEHSRFQIKISILLEKSAQFDAMTETIVIKE